jgi:hypothetical protein
LGEGRPLYLPLRKESLENGVERAQAKTSFWLGSDQCLEKMTSLFSRMGRRLKILGRLGDKTDGYKRLSPHLLGDLGRGDAIIEREHKSKEA